MIGMTELDARGPVNFDALQRYLREFVNSLGDPVPYDFGRALQLLLAALDNMRAHALEADLKVGMARLCAQRPKRATACCRRRLSPRPRVERPTPAWALAPHEQQAVLDALHSERPCDRGAVGIHVRLFEAARMESEEALA
jgi:hypothetical protein